MIKLFLTQLAKFHIRKTFDLIAKMHDLQNRLTKIFPITHICVLILCIFNDTGIVMTTKRLRYVSIPQRHA